MIDIVTLTGERYSFDPDTQRICKNDILVPSTEAEPVFSEMESGQPEFSGIYLKKTGRVVSRSGKINTVTDPNNIT